MAPIMGGVWDTRVKGPSRDNDDALLETPIHRGSSSEASEAASAHAVQGVEQDLGKVCQINRND
jgi:protoporphyrinogen oxidase